MATVSRDEEAGTDAGFNVKYLMYFIQHLLLNIDSRKVLKMVGIITYNNQIDKLPDGV
jgi:hypothetical protein